MHSRFVEDGFGRLHLGHQGKGMESLVIPPNYAESKGPEAPRKQGADIDMQIGRLT